MPTKRTRIGRKIQGLKNFQLAYLRDEDLSDANSDWGRLALEQLRNGLAPSAEHLWREFGSVYLAAFIKANPGKRPRPWWQWDAPRQPSEKNDCFWDGTLPEPRRRISGKGELHNGYVPAYEYGVPLHWNEDVS